MNKEVESYSLGKVDVVISETEKKDRLHVDWTTVTTTLNLPCAGTSMKTTSGTWIRRSPSPIINSTRKRA